MKQSTISIRPYYRSFFRNNSLCLITGLLATVADSACVVAVAWLMQQLIDACTGSPAALPFRRLLLVSVGILLLYFGAMQVERVTVSRFIPRAMAQYKQFLFSRIAAKSMAAFRRENTATYLSAISNDAQTIEMGVSQLFYTFNGLFRLVFAVGLMFRYSAVMMAGVLAVSVGFFFLSVPPSRKLIEAEQELSDHNEGVTARFKDFLTGFPVVKSFRAEKEMGRLFRKDVDKSAQSDRKRRMADSAFLIIMDGGISAVRVIILLVGAWMAISGRGLSAGMVMAFVQLLNHVISPVQELPLQLSDLKAASALIRKAAGHLEKNRRDEGTDMPPVLERGIRVEHLTFGYEPGKPVLQNISCTFEAGKRYALVGGSGSGKSTFLHLLMGGSAYEGTIRLDDRELQGISSASLYDLAALISQNVFLFNASLFDNITMFRKFPPEEVERAVLLSGLSPVMAEKGGDFLCGENGCNLSGGEKQRVSIARCLLRNSRLLLVDEATSSLDKETAATVAESLLHLEGVTEIVVTHALEPQILAQYDAILAIKDGRLEEMGTFDDLMARQGYFYSLYRVSR